jgi:MarR family transcriptional regulator, lower aerobic nicotinate degradation pathway regulator
VIREDIEYTTIAMDSIRSIVRALRISSRMIETTMGISGAQLFVLEQLAQRPAESLNDLAVRTATHQSSVSVVVRRLVERGFVARTTSPSDRRRVELSLTESGRRLLAGAPTTVQVKLLDGARSLTVQQRQTLAQLLAAWVKESGIEQAQPPMLMDELAESLSEA